MNNKKFAFLRLPSSNSKNKINQNINIRRSSTNNNLIRKKIDKEIKLQPEEFGLNLKRGLSKHELTSEIYIPKNIPFNKEYNKNLLIDKIQNYEKFKLEKKKIASKLSNNYFSSFSRIYNNIKEVEGKLNRQQQYFDEIERIYLGKDYNLKNCGIKQGENIFSYSILTDKTFGDNIKQDAIRLINEIKNNKDIRREPKIIFKLNNELIEQKLIKKLSNRNKTLIKKLITKNDYGIDSENNNYIKAILKSKKKKNKKNNIKKENSTNIILTKEDSKDNILKKEDNYLNTQLKLNLKKIEDNIENINNVFNNSYDDKDNIIKININNKYDKNDHYIRINSHFNTQNIYRQIDVSKIDKKNELIKDSNKDYFTNTIINIKKNFDKNDQKSMITQLPKIKSSCKELNKLNLSSNTTTNCSTEKDKNIIKCNSNVIITQSKNNISKRKNICNINNDNKDYPIKINLKKNNKQRIQKNNSFLKQFLNGDKNILNETEFNTYISKLEEKKSPLLQSFRKQKMKVSNIHGFASNFQRITERKDFNDLYEKNKFLKKNNYTNIISSYYETNEDNDVINIHDIDKKISNIYYDSADFILNDIDNKKKFM